VIESLILGNDPISHESDEYVYTKELGIIKENARKETVPANRIYGEVIARFLNNRTQIKIPFTYENCWISENGVNMDALLKEFQSFWRANHEILVKDYSDYPEAATHLILQAFLQRVFHGGAEIIREFAAGRKRADLCVKFKNKKYIIELKLFRNKATQDQGIEQISEYLDIHNEKKGWLLIFNREKMIRKDINSTLLNKQQASDSKSRDHPLFFVIRARPGAKKRGWSRLLHLLY